MTIFPLAIARFAQIAVSLLGWNRRAAARARAALDGLSDKGLKDIGLEPSRRDFDSVKPFWMP
jgi:uncharacterized protein YjiS (DUF1127 family)